MPKAKKNDVGFNVQKAIRSLHKTAIRVGRWSSRDVQSVNVELAASAHLHGIASEACNEQPCRLAGVCHALTELLDYQAELETPFVSFATLTEDVERWLSTTGFEYAQAIERVIEFGARKHRREDEWGIAEPLHDHAALCERPRRVLFALTELLQAVEVTKPRALLGIRQLRQSSRKKRSALLLAAVWQHLDWGGFPYDEIFALVPSDAVVADPGDVVRKQIARAEGRSLFPRDLHRNLRKLGKVDKSRRRRSST